VTETELLIYYSETELDVIDLSAVGAVVSSQVVGTDLQLTLAGGDNDIVVVRGITNINDVTFIL
jgi:hypothetical protein